MLEVTDRKIARRIVARQKTHRDGITPEFGQAQATALRPIAQQRVRHLDQAPGAVTDQGIGADRTAVIEIYQDLQAALDNVVRFSPFDIGDETDAAGVMFVARIVKSLSPGRGHIGCSSPDISFGHCHDTLDQAQTRPINNRHVRACELRLNRTLTRRLPPIPAIRGPCGIERSGYACAGAVKRLLFIQWRREAPLIYSIL